MTEPPLDSRLAKLELNARLYRYDKTLDDAANLFDSDVAAWQRLPLIVRDRSSFYMDARDSYRRYVEAGGVDDRGPDSATTERTTSW